MTSVRERALGAIFGQLVGDALGARYEFKKSGNKNKSETEIIITANHYYYFLEIEQTPSENTKLYFT